jgi:hypothetical protein
VDNAHENLADAVADWVELDTEQRSLLAVLIEQHHTPPIEIIR